MLSLLTLPLLLLLSESCSAFLNPIIPGFAPDPSILRVGDDYFLATSTFEYFPGIPIHHSKDLIDWKIVGHAFNRPSQLNMRGTANSGGLFAPTLRYHHGTYYVISTFFDTISPPDNSSQTPRSCYVHTTDPFDETKWSDPIYVDQAGFDPDLFWDDDGKVYFSSTNGANDFGHPNSGYFSIWTTEIDIKTGDNVNETRFSYQSELPLDTPRLAEGSHLYKINGTYHLLTAEAGTEVQHRAISHRGPSPYGPWEANPNGPLVFNGRDYSQPILATGHMDWVETPGGDWWAVFLGTRPQAPSSEQGKPQLGRETFMAPMTWVDGWPVVNNGSFITSHIPGLYDLPRPKTWREDFSGGKFKDKKWYTPRTPYKAFHSFPKGGGLTLRGNTFTLSQRETPAAFFRKQEDIRVITSTSVSFAPTTRYHEAGLSIFLSTWYHNEIGVTIDPSTNKTVIFATARSGELAQPSTMTVPWPENIEIGAPVTLSIRASEDKYELGYSFGGDQTKYIASVESKWLQSFVKGAQNFVGAHFAIYTTGNGLPILQPATFAYLQTELH